MKHLTGGRAVHQLARLRAAGRACGWNHCKGAKGGRPVRVEQPSPSAPPPPRGRRYLTPSVLDRQVAAGLAKVTGEERDKLGHLRKIRVGSFQYVGSDISRRSDPAAVRSAKGRAFPAPPYRGTPQTPSGAGRPVLREFLKRDRSATSVDHAPRCAYISIKTSNKC